MYIQKYKVLDIQVNYKYYLFTITSIFTIEVQSHPAMHHTYTYVLYRMQHHKTIALVNNACIMLLAYYACSFFCRTCVCTSRCIIELNATPRNNPLLNIKLTAIGLLISNPRISTNNCIIAC